MEYLTIIKQEENKCDDALDNNLHPNEDHHDGEISSQVVEEVKLQDKIFFNTGIESYNYKKALDKNMLNS